MTDCANLPNGASFCLSVGVYLKQHTHNPTPPPPPTPFPTLVYWGPVSPQLNPSLVLVVFFRASGCISISVPLIDGEEDRNAREGSG